MRTRADELRARHRKILFWSLAAALLIHAGVFLLSPEFEAVPLAGPETEWSATDSAGGEVSAVIDILFGPPLISTPDGSLHAEPPDRHLEAERGVQLPILCSHLARPSRLPLRASVALRVLESGRVEVLRLVESSGDVCADQVLADVAASLWYRWLPDERFRAPVQLIQPVTLTAVQD